MPTADQNVSVAEGQARAFGYTAKRDAFWPMLGLVGFLLAIESLVVLVLLLIIPNTGARIGLIAGWAALTGYVVFGFLLAPLRTRHRLSADNLVVHYGLDRFTLPRVSIIAAQPVTEKLALFQNVRAQLVAPKQRIVACFSAQGQVLLYLARPASFRIDATTALANRVLINLDDRDGFLAALDLPRVPTETSTPPVAPPPMVAPTLLGPVRSNGNIAIQAEQLTRRFGSFVAVDNLDLAVQTGEIYGFLGANGAGKTTSMNMMVGLLSPTSGRAMINGHDVWADALAAKQALGYVPDRALLYERLSGREFLAFLGQLRGLSLAATTSRSGELLELLELADHADRPASAYSFGMKRKLALAGALLHQPPVLILDEPLNGLDPRSARRIKDLLIERAAAGNTVFLSTHDLATAESICHRVGIVKAGRLLAEGSAAELRQLAAAPDLESVFLTLTAEEGAPAL